MEWNHQLNSISSAFDINKDGDIEFEELLHTIENNRKHSKHYIESAKKHQSTTSHVVKSKKQMQDEWRQARLEASNKAQSPEMAEKEIKEKDREHRRKIAEDQRYRSDHIAFTNDPLKGARIYDAALVRKFGHVNSMNELSTCRFVASISVESWSSANHHI